MDGLLYEPLTYYTSVAREKHKKHVKERFDELVRASGIAVEENRACAAAYREALALVERVQRQIRRLKLWRGLLIALAVIGGVLALYGGATIADGPGLWLLLGGLTSLALSLILIFTVIRRRLGAADKLREQRQAVADERLRVAEAQMAPLNALFRAEDTFRLIERTMPEVTFFPTYMPEHQELLINEYDYVDLTDDDTSVTDTLGGTLCGNPFLFERYLCQQMGTHVYHGSMLISWTELTRDSKGNLHRVRRTQTLHASVQKPKPQYHLNTHLGFGAQAAPDLSFSRNESDTDELSDRALARRIRRGARKLQKRTEAAEEGDED